MSATLVAGHSGCAKYRMMSCCNDALLPTAAIGKPIQLFGEAGKADAGRGFHSRLVLDIILYD